MKIQLKRASSICNSFVELARAIEGNSELGVSESLELAKRVVYSTDGSDPATTLVVDEGRSFEEIRSACEKCGVEATQIE